MTPLSAVGFLTAGVIIACWLAWLTWKLQDLGAFTQQALTGRPHGEPADNVDVALRRFSFGGGNDGRGGLNFVSDETRHAQAMSIHGDGMADGSVDATEGKRDIHGE